MKFYPTLQETLARRFEDMDEVRDVSNHGISGGFNGFIYNYELNEFFNEFESEIEEYMFDMFGDGWLVNIANDSSNIQDMINTVVYIVAESWCHHKVDLIDEAIAA
tara:strand:- start:322 stop:639 length:318 start_codon:yes stop_codon:yes gene_type:complete